jgi:hypothetical protein
MTTPAIRRRQHCSRSRSPLKNRPGEIAKRDGEARRWSQ